MEPKKPDAVRYEVVETLYKFGYWGPMLFLLTTAFVAWSLGAPIRAVSYVGGASVLWACTWSVVLFRTLGKKK